MRCDKAWQPLRNLANDLGKPLNVHIELKCIFSTYLLM